MVVVDRNLFDTPPNELNSAQVVATIVGGKVVYRRGENGSSEASPAAPLEDDSDAEQ